MEFNRRSFVKGAAATAAFLPQFNVLRGEDITEFTEILTPAE